MAYLSAHHFGQSFRRLFHVPRQAVYRLYGIDEADPAPHPDQLGDMRQAEIAAQIQAIRRETPIRLVVIALISGMFLAYLPAALILPLSAGVLLFDAAERHLIHLILTRGAGGKAYAASIVSVYLGEFLFSLPASIIWRVEDMFTKAISIGVLAAAMMRLATIRSIHPATGFAGTAAMATLIAVSNTTYWIGEGNVSALALTSLIAVVAVGYLVSAIIQNHRQQRNVAVSKLAVQRASAAKSQFLMQLSHELRTPLNAIVGLGTAAHLTTTDQNTMAQLAVLVKSAEGMAVVLDDVLDMAAVEEGHLRLRARAANIREEVASSVGLFKPQAIAAGLDLRLTFDPALPDNLHLDFGRLRQCLSNLLSNALKHTPQGFIQVSVAFFRPGRLRVDVIDSGDGVAKPSIATLFLPQDSAPATSGHGLSLAICRNLARGMGGDVLHIPTASGATFRIEVPASRIQSAPPPPAAPSLADLQGTRVLVIDDIATNRLVAATYLRLLNCHATEAESGAAALAILASQPDFDLILLDINMPGMDGIATLRAIRNLRDGLGVIAMTADASEADRRRYLDAGMQGYVAKPIRLQVLQSEICRVMALQKAHA